MTLVANSGHDENGRWTYGKAGDQDGTEWRIMSWYYFRQNVVLRHPNAKVRQTLARIARDAANNNHIGYDQMQRTSFWNALKKVGYEPKNIRVDTEQDCSSGTAALVKATGYLLGDKKLQAVSEDCWTGNLRLALMAAGFQALYGDAYCLTGKNLIPGDINLNESQHVNIVVQGDGSTSSDKLEEDGLWGSGTTRRLQKHYKTPVDGEIWNQWLYNQKGWCTTGWKWNTTGIGSPLIKAMQKDLKTGDSDGLAGDKFWKSLMKRTGKKDGYSAVKEMQRRLNKGDW